MGFPIVKITVVFGIGLALVITPFALGAIVSDEYENVVASALVKMLFISGVGTIFSAFFLSLLHKVPKRVKSVLGCIGLAGFLFGIFVIEEQQHLPVIFSPALLAYPALGLVIMCLLTPLLEKPSR